MNFIKMQKYYFQNSENEMCDLILTLVQRLKFIV